MTSFPLQAFRAHSLLSLHISISLFYFALSAAARPAAANLINSPFSRYRSSIARHFSHPKSYWSTKWRLVKQKAPGYTAKYMCAYYMWSKKHQDVWLRICIYTTRKSENFSCWPCPCPCLSGYFVILRKESRSEQDVRTGTLVAADRHTFYAPHSDLWHCNNT